VKVELPFPSPGAESSAAAPKEPKVESTEKLEELEDEDVSETAASNR
jgi:hypothetical protein